MKYNRLKQVISNMERCGLSQILVTSTPSVYYLTGLWIAPGERMFVLYINSNGSCRLFANQLFALRGNTPEGLSLTEFSDTQDPVSYLAGTIRPGKLGIDKWWPSQFTIRLMEARRDICPVLGSAPVDDARMYKDSEEIALMRESSRLNDIALKNTIACIEPGMTEHDLANIYAAKAEEAGGTGPGFEPITCFGANCAEPHHANDRTQLKPGDSIILDVGLMYRRYCSDMTRTVFLGNVSDEQRRVYEICRKANEAGRAAIHPGVPMSDFDRAARKVIEDAGYGPYFIHRTGHGVGLEIHEPPDNSSGSSQIAGPGMCFSVEPGIYLPGRFGVRIEDLVCVTEDGCETLNHADRDLMVL